MQKICTLILIILLSSCDNHKSIACSNYNGNDQITITLNAYNDNISEVFIDEKYELSNLRINDENAFINYLNEIDKNYVYLDGYLYRNTTIIPDDIYSLSMTIKKLNSKRYHCE